MGWRDGVFMILGGKNKQIHGEIGRYEECESVRASLTPPGHRGL